MDRLIIGTVGHIDHGKTSLIKELTGFEGDATPEEKRRGITIELSFSSMSNADKEISFIDVPGHEKLVKTMIGGAFGFDYALVAIDAKEGAKAQTLEHLSILNTIKKIGVIIAVTKSDLVSEDELSAQIDAIRRLLSEYPNLTIIDILPSSLKDKSSIERVRSKLFALATKNKTAKPLTRLYIDRCFALSGTGCVITGTLLGGEIKTKDTLFIPQLQKNVKVRSIQTHGKAVDIALPGQRTAVNLSDISHTQIKKGMLLTQKGFLRGFKTIDVLIQKNKEQKIEHEQELIAYFGTLAAEAKVLILQESPESILATLKFKNDMFSMFEEPFILRNSVDTIGGGVVIGAVADPLKKNQKLQLLDALAKKDFKSAFEILIQAHQAGFGLICSMQRFGITHEEALVTTKGMQNVIIDEKSLAVYPKKALSILKNELKKIYSKNKFAMLSSSSVKFKLPWASEYISALAFDELESEGILVKENGLYMLLGNNEKELWQTLSENISEILEGSDFTPPAPYNIYDEMDIDRSVGDDILKKLCSSHKAVRLAHNHFIGSLSLSKALSKIREIIKENGFADVGSVKEGLNISRKYAVNYLEHLDRFDDIDNIEQRRTFKKHQ